MKFLLFKEFTFTDKLPKKDTLIADVLNELGNVEEKDKSLNIDMLLKDLPAEGIIIGSVVHDINKIALIGKYDARIWLFDKFLKRDVVSGFTYNLIPGLWTDEETLPDLNLFRLRDALIRVQKYVQSEHPGLIVKYEQLRTRPHPGFFYIRVNESNKAYELMQKLNSEKIYCVYIGSYLIIYKPTKVAIHQLVQEGYDVYRDGVTLYMKDVS